MDLDASTAVRDISFKMAGSKLAIPPCLKKFGSATTKPKVEISKVCTTTARLLNSLVLAASKFKYFWSL